MTQQTVTQQTLQTITATICAIALGGCSTVYQPRATGRVSPVLQGGTVKFARDGKVGDLDEAVKGNPAAESEARSYRTLIIAGASVALAGIAGLVGGTVLAPKDNNSPPSAASAGLLLGGFAAAVVGDILLIKAVPHLYDALNIFNDGVEPQRSNPPPTPASQQVPDPEPRTQVVEPPPAAEPPVQPPLR